MVCDASGACGIRLQSGLVLYQQLSTEKISAPHNACGAECFRYIGCSQYYLQSPIACCLCDVLFSTRRASCRRAPSSGCRCRTFPCGSFLRYRWCRPCTAFSTSPCCLIRRGHGPCSHFSCPRNWGSFFYGSFRSSFEMHWVNTIGCMAKGVTSHLYSCMVDGAANNASLSGFVKHI